MVNVKAKAISLITLSLVMCFGALGFCEDVKFEASLDRDRITLGERVQLGLTFYQTQSMPAPDLGSIDGIEMRYLGPSTMMTVINGKVSNSITHMYSITPLRIGKFQIGPFTFPYAHSTYVCNPVFLQVSEEAIPVAATRPVASALTESLDFKDRIYLTLKMDKEQAYAYELIPVIVKLYVKRLNVRDIQLPTFEQENFSKAEFREPKQYREDIGGSMCDVLEFKTTIFATRPGEYQIGPANIKANVILQKRGRGMRNIDDFFAGPPFDDQLTDDFFTRYEKQPVDLKSQAGKLTVLPLPQEGRPADFSGAIGDFQFIFNVNPKKVKVGDPVTLSMEINGTGNFNTVLMPVLSQTDGYKVYDPHVKTEANTKSFTQVLIPTSDTITKTPSAVFNYFDPNKREYKTIKQGPLVIQVEKGQSEVPATVVGAPSTVVETPVGEQGKALRDIIYIKDSLGSLKESNTIILDKPLFRVTLAGLTILLIVLAIVAGRIEKLRFDPVYAGRKAAFRSIRSHRARLLRALRGGEAKIFYGELFKSLQDYFGNRYSMPPLGVTHDAVEVVLRKKEVSQELLANVKALFYACDAARFAFVVIDISVMKDHFKEFEEIVRIIERERV